MRKPNSEIYKYVLNEHDLQQNAHYSLMIKENTDAALLLGLQVWNLQVGKEDVVDLFNKTYYRNPL
jgi:putative hydrolase of the HAD superfamily